MSAIDQACEELLRLAQADQDGRRLDCYPCFGQGVPEQELTAAERDDLDHLRTVDTSNTAR